MARDWPQIRISPETRDLVDNYRGDQTRDEVIRQGITRLVQGGGEVPQAAVSLSGRPPWGNPTTPPQTMSSDAVLIVEEEEETTGQTAAEELAEAEAKLKAWRAANQ